ncbi:MAG: hypothetical protein IPF96_19950 [Rhodobacter sp.]|jgi:hypothetical protein|nr:hypothetical protein [Rhodobacter sp.]
MRKPKVIDGCKVAFDRMTAQGLDVRNVSLRKDGAFLVSWNRPPTEAERALANSLLPGALHDA